MSDALKRAARVDEMHRRYGSLIAREHETYWQVRRELPAEQRGPNLTESTIASRLARGDAEHLVELGNSAVTLAADVRQLVDDKQKLQEAHDNLARELRRQRDASTEYQERATNWLGETAGALLGPDPEPSDEALILPALARKVRGRLDALVALWEACKPLAQHDPQVADLAQALGLLEPPRIEDPTVASERGGDTKEVPK